MATRKLRKNSEFGGSPGRHGFQPEVPEARTHNDMPATTGHDALSASEQLRLIYSTGQDDDPTLPRDTAAFRGNQHRRNREDEA